MRRVQITYDSREIRGCTGFFKEYQETSRGLMAIIEVECVDHLVPVGGYEFVEPHEQTMTPRLQLAGMAMQGYIASLRADDEPVEIKTAIAEECLQIADAMLAESEKKS